MLEPVSNLQFWIALTQIFAVNLALSGGNGTLIALAARSLPQRRRRQAVFWGTISAVAIRMILTVIAFEMLRLPYMKIVGGILLLWVAVQLLMPEFELDQTPATSAPIVTSAGYGILLGNLAMSLDNVLAVAAAAADNNLMLTLGLAVSILTITIGSPLVTAVMARLPVLYTLCAALIGYLAGDMLVGDVVIKDWIQSHMHWLQSVNFGDFGLSVSGLIGITTVFLMARMYHLLTIQGHEGGTAEIGNVSSIRQYLGFMTTQLSGYRISTLLPFAVVIVVTYLGHPLHTHYRDRLAPPIRYYDLSLGMTQDEVVHAKGHPAYVQEDLGNGKQVPVKFADIPGAKTAKDYDEWEFPVGKSEAASLEVIYSKKTKQVTQINCYSHTGYCLPVSGVSTGASEDEVVDKLGAPRNVKVSNEFHTFDYPDLNLSILLEGKRVLLLSVHRF